MARTRARLLYTALALLLVVTAAGAAHAHDTGSDQNDCRLCRQVERPGVEPETPSVAAPVHLPAAPTVAAIPIRVALDTTCPVGRRGPPALAD